MRARGSSVCIIITVSQKKLPDMRRVSEPLWSSRLKIGRQVGRKEGRSEPEAAAIHFLGWMYRGCTVRERGCRVKFDKIFQVLGEEGRGEEEKARAGNGRGLCMRRPEGRQKAVRGGALLVQGQARRRRRAAPVLEDERREIVCAPEDCMGQWNRARLKYGAGKVGVNRVRAGGRRYLCKGRRKRKPRGVE